MILVNKMRFLAQLCLLLYAIEISLAQNGVLSTTATALPTLYEYYTENGIHSGLQADNPNHFTLNSKPIVLFSGTLHYFRVVPEHWSRTLLQYKAAGLNAIQFYLPWNMHEDIPGRFDFESAWLDLDKFLQLIKQADMFAVVRPGPYICAEWEFGGLPSWLLRDTQMSLRSNYAPYKNRVKLFWDRAMEIINKHQFSVTGGPVIMLQIENEYSPFMDLIPESRDYLRFLFKITRESGFRELIFMSDNLDYARHYPIKGIFQNDSVLQTVNGNEQLLDALMELRVKQPGKPVYVSEFWSGWFDAWYGKHSTDYTVKKMEKEMLDTLFVANGSLNLYPFIGGTNFGFTNSRHVTTSWDFDAPLTVNGNYTEKYYKTREIYEKLIATGRLPKVKIPDIPQAPISRAYESIKIVEFIPLEKILENATKFVNIRDPQPMELLGKDYGQRFGFVLYRVEGKGVQQYEIFGRIRHRGIVLIDNHEIATLEDSKYFSHSIEHSNAYKTRKFDLLIENLGRVNWPVSDMNKARTGLVLIDDFDQIIKAQFKLDQKTARNITIFSLDFEKSFVKSLNSGWEKFDPENKPINGPTMYRAELVIEEETPVDTFLYLTGWNKGNAFVNGFNLGRYWSVGPQQTLYIPGPLLKTGINLIDIFELHNSGTELHFADCMIWK